MTTLPLIILTLSFFITTATSHNITDILNNFPQYSDFNKYLSQTKLDDEINNRQSITVLVFNNNIVSEFLSNESLPTVKIALSIHVLLDYFDLKKLQHIGGGSMTTTTLYQTTGKAVGSTGFVNITDLAGGNVGFGSSSGSDARLDALYFRSVKQIPYNISVLEINSPIIAAGVLTAASSSNVNISSVLEKAGCKKFARLISETGVLKVYETVEPRGLTVFAPTDNAFMDSRVMDLGNFTDAERISLLLYHAIPDYFPKVSLMNERKPMRTLASNEIAEFGLTVKTNGESVTLDSGVDNSRVESMVIDSVPLSVFKIDHVLVPVEYNKPSPAPAPETFSVQVPEASPPFLHARVPVPVSSPLGPNPVQRPVASSPAPVEATSPVVSPPAPPVSPSSPPASLSPPGSSPGSGPGPAPADGPTADGGSSNASGGIKAPVVLLAVIMVTVSGIISSVFG